MDLIDMPHWADPYIAGLTVAGSFILITAAFGWKARDWLAEQFSETRRSFHEKIEAHELIDQKRHEENLERFADIRVELARKNGDARSRS